MKKLILFFIALVAFNNSFAQDLRKSEVPSVVLNQFNSKFPKAFDVEWEKDGDLYKVEFETKWNNDHDVWFNSEGKIIKQKEELSARDLPQAIKDYINQEYKNYKVDDVDKITENNRVVYKVEVENRKREINLFFNEDGTLVE